MLTFQAEKLTEALDELQPLLRLHWEEIALNKDAVPLDPDWEMYSRMEEMGMIHMTTARESGRLVGYSAYFLMRNLHYRSLYVAETDVFYLLPEFRKGTAGIRLLRAAEENLRALGVNKIVSKVKLHFDTGPIFERLGYAPIERLYAKLVG